MATPLQTLYTAAQALVLDIITVANTVVTQAPTNYGTDFRISAGAAFYQIRIVREKDWINSNVNYPRAICSVFFHHYVTSLANESAFVHDTMSVAAGILMDSANWRGEAGVYDLQPGIDPEISDGDREGKIITFEISAVVLMDPV